eukprot:945307-Pelagomonas_calceolata.AAC.2
MRAPNKRTVGFFDKLFADDGILAMLDVTATKMQGSTKWNVGFLDKLLADDGILAMLQLNTNETAGTH